MTAAAPAPSAASAAAWQPTPDPLFPVPTDEQLAAVAAAYGEEAVLRSLEEREELIRLRESDPWNHGYEPEDTWGRADRMVAEMERLHPGLVKWLLTLGGNRAGKTEYAAKRAMQMLVNKPGSRVWCLHSTQSASRQSQMPLLWKYLPPEWKPAATGRNRKGVTTKIVYTQAGGFTDDTFVLPNGSQCWFKFYASDVRTVEGVELDLAWADELVPMDWLDAIAFRLATRAGLGLVTFTPIEGYTPVVGRFLDNARTIEDMPAPELPLKGPGGETVDHERVPLAQICAAEASRVVYFPTVSNPWSNYPAVLKEAEKTGRNGVLVRCYGVPQKVKMARFPRFRDDVHVIPRDRVPKGAGTWYHVVDPCNGRNFAMLWAVATPGGDLVIAREWPQVGDYTPGVGEHGPWAVTGSKRDGDPGPAQDPYGLGLQGYKDEIDRVEKELSRDGAEGIAVHLRCMDSRFGNAPTLAKSEATTLIEEFGEGYGLEFIPAFGNSIDDGVSLINDALAYDPGEQLGPANKPRLYVCEDCTNTIFALRHWTGADGQKGACKDFVDLLRYLMLLDPEHVEDKAYQTVGGGSY